MASKKKVKKNIDPSTVEALSKKVVMIDVSQSQYQQQIRAVKVSDLPECSFKDDLLKIILDPDTSIICVVAFENPDKTWAVYVGYPDVRDIRPIIKDLHIQSIHQPAIFAADILWRCENIRGADETLMMGELLPREAAGMLFPEWKEKTYVGSENEEG